MEKRSTPVPDNKNYEYSNTQAFQIAVERFKKVTDYGGLSEKSGSAYDARRDTISLKYLGRDVWVTVPSVNIALADSSEEIPIRERILVLHYLLTARGTPLNGNPVTFKELFEGPNYFRTFTQRTIKHIVANFSEHPEKLIASGKKLGGEKAAFGDASITIPGFNRVPVTLVVWRGDEEFPADGSVLYDSSVSDYLPTEDIIILTETIIWKMAKSLPDKPIV